MTGRDRRGWLLTSVEVDSQLTDCRIFGDRITELGPELVPTGEVVIDGRGGALLPGLADHHLHLRAAAVARVSLDASGLEDLGPLVGRAPGTGWLRIIGAEHDVGRTELDRLWPDRPVRVQHRSGMQWTLNSAATARLADHLDETERDSGRLRRNDRALRHLLADTAPDIAGLGIELARYGLTHLTDATPDLDGDDLCELDAAIPQHLMSLSAAVDQDTPAKLLADDDKLDTLADDIERFHASGRPVAVHAVTLPALVYLVAILERLGARNGDRIEHAAVCDEITLHRIADLGVTVVTQPTIWARRGSRFIAESPPEHRDLLWRHGSFIAAGVATAVSSDAPYGDPNPWLTMQAAATREGAPSERVPARAVLRSLLATSQRPGGEPRRLTVGAAADVVLLDRPLGPALSSAQPPVRLVLIDGTRAWAQ